MTTSKSGRPIGACVTRHFSFTRLQDDLIARAYQVLIPVVSRPLAPPSRRRDHGPIPTRPGERMTIGDVELEVVRIAAPCRLLDDDLGPGAMQALKSPRGGTVFRLLGSGTIRVGDEAEVQTPTS